MSDNRYNGWSNYETWNAKLWIDNDQGTQEYWNERAMECLSDAEGDAADAEDALARELESSHDEACPMLEGMYADILSAALGAIDWHEIAAAIIADNLDEWRDNNPTDEESEDA